MLGSSIAAVDKAGIYWLGLTDTRRGCWGFPVPCLTCHVAVVDEVLRRKPAHRNVEIPPAPPPCAAIAQLVERLICNQQVGSSTLPGGFFGGTTSPDVFSARFESA